uniref:flagellar type III secretion system pore protein FliP n=1 Tax=Psychromonas sp. Urea-02u-13 TaxID=2058326 RepID=UPI0018E2DB45|nr:flagellar type III secretion system pore protein FliP [Psychromonas sp. Urea-02u-13]
MTLLFKSLIGVLLLLPLSVYANEGLSVLSITDTPDGQDYSVKLQILLLMTALSLIPAFILMCTCFTRIIIVLSILRQALGLQQSPPNQVLVGIALCLSILIMKPVWSKVYDSAFVPYDNGQITMLEAASIAEKPIKAFMLRQTHVSSLEQMMKIGGEDESVKPEDLSIVVVLPAFVISELKTAFQIGFMIFLPFLIVDLVVASVLMSMGMMMLSPLIVSLPFKLMIFVLVDGWTMLVGSLSSSFG